MYPKIRIQTGAVLRVKTTLPPDNEGGWFPLSREFIQSPAYRSLSINAHKVFHRMIDEHLAHGRLQNGELIVTHRDFREYGVSPNYIGDAIDELAFKGVIKVRRGRAGAGTAHPNLYTLTMTGTFDGAPATNDWKRQGEDCAERWDSCREKHRKRRARVGRKKKPR